MFNILRFKGLERREYECEVVTPLFLGGEDPRKAELRVPPFKAAMRFWWRAQYGGEDVKHMAEKEAAIFGSTEKKSIVSVQLDKQSAKIVPDDLPSGKKIMVTSKGKGKTFPISIIEYLAYGLFDPKQKKYSKNHVEPKSHFKIIVISPENVGADVFKALKAMISFGGLGARSRNGFGSLHCDSLIDRTVKKEGELKSFTSFSKEAILFNKFNAWMNWEDALYEIGMIYRQARLNLEGRHEFQKRSLIAMPIESKKNGRHAKPYFLHVNKTPEGKYRGQILFLPYEYKTGPAGDLGKVNEYMAVCKKMNDEIEKGMGGKK